MRLQSLDEAGFNAEYISRGTRVPTYGGGGKALPRGADPAAGSDSRRYRGTSHWVGRRVPYHCSANGKVLLAFSAAGATAGELEPRTSRTIVEPARLAAELESVRREGFAPPLDQLELGLRAV